MNGLYASKYGACQNTGGNYISTRLLPFLLYIFIQTGYTMWDRYWIPTSFPQVVNICKYELYILNLPERLLKYKATQ